jgi:hypothetical protein
LIQWAAKVKDRPMKIIRDARTGEIIRTEERRIDWGRWALALSLLLIVAAVVVVIATY